nr:hypothetical protein [Rhodoferax sp.]
MPIDAVTIIAMAIRVCKPSTKREHQLLTTPEALQHLPSAVSDRLRSAAKQFVKSKYLLDKAIAIEGGKCLAGELSGSQGSPDVGTSFFLSVFPFAYGWKFKGAKFSTLVQTELTLGCSWKWRGRELTPEERKARLEFFTTLEPQVRIRAGQEATYFWIRSLGLLLPNEGKNRVDFLREEGIESIPALVAEVEYPDPDRIVLYQVKAAGRQECWAVLDGRWVQRVPHPSWAKPLLDAYGVQEEQRWPLAFPQIDEVLKGFERPSGHPDFASEDIVDLEQIASSIVRKQEIVLCSLMEIRSIRIRSMSSVFYWLGALTASLVCMFFLPKEWTVGLAVWAGIVFGLCAGSSLMYVAPMLRTTRATIDQDAIDRHRSVN